MYNLTICRSYLEPQAPSDIIEHYLIMCEQVFVVSEVNYFECLKGELTDENVILDNDRISQNHHTQQVTTALLSSKLWKEWPLSNLYNRG